MTSTPAEEPANNATVVDMTKRLPHPPEPAAAPAPAFTAPRDDEAPLIPEWIKSREGRRAARRQMQRQAHNTGRRWVRRQKTERGHHAQIGRGVIRVHSWVVGVEGVHAHAAKHHAHMATKDARATARQARFTVVGRDKARAVAMKHQEEAQHAVAAHKKARREVSRGRMVRGVVAYGLPAAADAAAFVEAGWLGGIGALATLGGLALIGRKPLRAERWDPERRSIGDGDSMNDTMLNDAFRRAGIIAKDAVLTVVHPCGYGRGAWQATVDLPDTTVTAAMKRTEELAGQLGVETVQVSLSRAGRANRLHIWVSTTVPFTGDPVRGPLLGMDKPMSLWGRVPIGPTLRGDAYTVSLIERSGLVGGEPGAGKSASGNNILLAAALDPHCILCLADGKGGGDLEPFEPLCDQYEGEADPEAFFDLLGDVIVDMKLRYALLKSLGKRKVTEALCREYPLLRLKLLWVDELMFFTTDEEWGRKITARLRNIVSRGRAAGIITFCATQKPGSDVVATSLRDLLSIRWALRCTTPQASDTILGQGAASAGFNAKDIEASMRGAGWLYSEGSAPEMVLAYYYSDDEVTDLIERAYRYRAAAGTLPTAAPTLTDRLRAAGGDGVVLAVLLEEYTVGDGADWLPTSVLLKALADAGQLVTDRRLGDLVVRSDEDKVKRPWEGARVAGYSRQLVADTAEKWLADR
ncbi:FtsK/SpoIIIE domain-containing protein [Streptantibioticus silvisoli]|uniref:FtsK/SpoIIIE domain-containing protein n=1 Tax=Streptantibioticus silvisoli TaxID=2705255 RepID=A0ABT6W268_9ACTN|nr:FtsK/SpoIIIE domain-containing protein [Streptantibioticus silvisoli]MDI5964843.1 FtsK/SpoIIIE domain-containing protein [Streptantibioticus silvisoli]